MLSEDSQEADKPVLPALGGDRGGGNFSHTDLTLTDLSVHHLYKNIKNTVYIFRAYGLLKIQITPLREQDLYGFIWILSIGTMCQSENIYSDKQKKQQHNVATMWILT